MCKKQNLRGKLPEPFKNVPCKVQKGHLAQAHNGQQNLPNTSGVGRACEAGKPWQNMQNRCTWKPQPPPSTTTYAFVELAIWTFANIKYACSNVHMAMTAILYVVLLDDRAVAFPKPRV